VQLHCKQAKLDEEKTQSSDHNETSSRITAVESANHLENRSLNLFKPNVLHKGLAVASPA